MNIKYNKLHVIFIGIVALMIISLVVISINMFTKKETKASETKSTISKTLTMGAVELNVKDLALVKTFYKDLVGLQEIETKENEVGLGDNGEVLVRLIEDKSLTFAPKTEAGLYHLALVFSTQSKLANTLQTIFQKQPAYYQGSSDHVATEAFYFGDPEGNGVELYFDKPRTEWKYGADGKPLMGSTYIDEQDYVKKHANLSSNSGVITMGHVHLKVGDILRAKKFYNEIMLFDVINNMGTALFVSKDNYHHHLGMNTWESNGAGVRKSGFTGLKRYEIKYFDKDLMKQVRENLVREGFEVKDLEDGSFVTGDYWGNEVVVKFSNT